VVIAFASILDSRVSFELAAFFVTWIAIAFLGLIAVSLHIRLQRLERIDLGRDQATPFGHLLGKTADQVLNGFTPRPQPRLILFLSSSCSACEQLLAELKSPGWNLPAAIVWTSLASDRIPELPPHASLVPDGPRISAALGIRVTPFALVAGEGGAIVRASPINSLDSLRDAIKPSRESSFSAPSR
jgi:hypothetical protein